jgi:hypothetical protein
MFTGYWVLGTGYWVLECWEFRTAGTMFFEPKLLFLVSDMYMNGCYCAMASCTWLFMLRKNGYTIQK